MNFTGWLLLSSLLPEAWSFTSSSLPDAVASKTVIHRMSRTEVKSGRKLKKNPLNITAREIHPHAINWHSRPEVSNFLQGSFRCGTTSAERATYYDDDIM
jgi:hypothetical protein